MATPTSSNFRVHVARPDSDYDKVPREFSRSNLPPSAKVVALYLQSHNPTFNLTQSGIATALGMSRNTVSKALKVLEDEGHLQVVGGMYNLTLLKNCADSAQKLSTALLKNCAHKETNQKIKGNNSNTSVSASADPVDIARQRGEKTDEAWPLHPEWSPNNSNRSEAAEWGLDVELMAQVFRDSDLATENRTCWGSAFTRYLRDYAEDTSGTTFGIDDDAVGAAVLDAAAAQLRAPQSAPADQADPAPTSPEPVPEPVQAGNVQELADTPAPVITMDPVRSVAAELQRLERSMVRPLVAEERTEAERLLAAGESREQVKAVLRAMGQARKARMRAELSRVPVPIPA